jgi:hypothetical protein
MNIVILFQALFAVPVVLVLVALFCWYKAHRKNKGLEHENEAQTHQIRNCEISIDSMKWRLKDRGDRIAKLRTQTEELAAWKQDGAKEIAEKERCQRASRQLLERANRQLLEKNAELTQRLTESSQTATIRRLTQEKTALQETVMSQAAQGDKLRRHADGLISQRTYLQTQLISQRAKWKKQLKEKEQQVEEIRREAKRDLAEAKGQLYAVIDNSIEMRRSLDLGDLKAVEALKEEITELTQSLTESSQTATIRRLTQEKTVAEDIVKIQEARFDELKIYYDDLISHRNQLQKQLKEKEQQVEESRRDAERTLAETKGQLYAVIDNSVEARRMCWEEVLKALENKRDPVPENPEKVSQQLGRRGPADCVARELAQKGQKSIRTANDENRPPSISPHRHG